MKWISFYFLLIIAFNSFSTQAKQPYNFYAEKAGEAFSKGNYEDGLAYARQEISDYPDNPKGYINAALCLYVLNESGQALSMVNKALALSKKDKNVASSSYLLKAEIQKSIGDTLQAIQTLEKGMKNDSKNLNLLIDHAKTISNKQYKRALAELEKAKKMDPSDPRPFAHSAAIFASINNYQYALEEIDQALLRDKTSSYYFALSGLIKKNLRKSPEWIQDCLNSEIISEGTGEAFDVLADTESVLDQNTILAEIYKQKKDYPELFRLEAGLLIEWKKYDKAIELLKEVINSNEADNLIYSQLALLQKDFANLMDAYRTISDGLDKYPQDSGLMFWKAQIGNQVGKGKEVLPILDILIAANPDNDQYFYEKGLTLMNLGRYEEAINPLSMAVTLQPSLQHRLVYADALRLAGKESKANEIYYQLLDIRKGTPGTEGIDFSLLHALAYSGLGKTVNTVKNLEQSENPVGYAPSIYARLYDYRTTLSLMAKQLTGSEGSALFDFLGYNYHPLHSNPEFAEILRKVGFNTAYNSSTKLLEFVPFEAQKNMGGNSIESLKSIDRNSSTTEYIQAINAQCPIDMGMMGQLTSIEYDPINSKMIYNLTSTPGFINYDALNSKPNYKKRKEDAFALTMYAANPEMATFGVTYVYNLTAADGSGHISFTVSPQKIKDLKRITSSQDEIDKINLNLWVEEDKIFAEENPSQMGTVNFDGKTYSSICSVSEADGTFTSMDLFRDDIKKQMLSQYQDLAYRSRAEVFLRQGITLKFIMKGDLTGRTIEVVLTPEDFASILN